MMTLGDVKEYLAPFINGGMCADDPRVMRTIDEAIERLVQKPTLAYKLLVRHIQMPLRGSYVTLPRCVDKIINARIDNSPSTGVFSKWYEFLDNGPGPESDCSLGLVDLGEVCTQFDNPVETGAYLIVSSDREEDAGVQLHVRGTDINGREVRDAQDRLGEFLDIPGGTSASKSYGLFSRVANIRKPVTAGYVFISAIDPLTGEIFMLGHMAPAETVPSYRRYQLNGLGYKDDGDPFCATLKAMVKLRPVPLTHDTDVLLVNNRPALKAMCQAIYFYDSGDADKGAAYEVIAERIMVDETINYSQGTDDTLNIQVDSWGAGEVAPLM